MNNNFSHPEPDQLQAYFDQELDQESTRFIQQHLENCQLCQKELNRLNLIVSRLETLPEILPEVNLSGEVLNQLQTHKQFSRGITWTLVLEALAAGIVIGFVIPVVKAAAWLPKVMNTPTELLTAVNIFLTQLVSTWMVWAAQVQLTITEFLNPQQIQIIFPSQLPSPWIIILITGSLAAIINYLLLRFKPIRNGNQNH
jgi:anti-sigma factor RsiW